MSVIFKLLLIPFGAAFTFVITVVRFLKDILDSISALLWRLFVICALLAIFFGKDFTGGMRALAIAFALSPVGLPFVMTLLIEWLEKLWEDFWDYLES